ncbi:MAG: hydantoinase B/oxoprolinase family protein, partial [Wenzhouxiangellaceae bacterium]|nr:hydantoinase B/oxoprolinase family protein [Wenzhouxiangellaceae bacterium]
LILNDPYSGGTHLPDVTLVAPVFADGERAGFVANRAHHADIGTATPGSMPLSASLSEEGVLIEPTWLFRDSRLDSAALDGICSRMRNPQLAAGDFQAQAAASATGERLLGALVAEAGRDAFSERGRALDDYARRLASKTMAGWPRGAFSAEDAMDDDGLGGSGPTIRVRLEIGEDGLVVDFDDTDDEVGGNLNCPMSVTAAAVFYAVRCLLPAETPACAGSLAAIDMRAPRGCLVNATHPSATAAGNVETSQRIVDVVFRALAEAMPDRIPAASQGTMNNLGLGSERWSYYETMAGGCGATASTPGRHAVHSHMTNTLNTPAEVLEAHFPLRVTGYRQRRGSGGSGRVPGGDGLEREIEFLEATDVTLITERRRLAPWGLDGGGDGARGENRLDGEILPAKTHFRAESGQRLTIRTPGGGGYGSE